MTSAMDENRLGIYLKDRRGRMDPSAFGLPTGRRRTPGLRREEVAHRANVSATWYTWLEQGRGGAPSAGVLERIAEALMLTQVEREHLFLLGLGRPPENRFVPESEEVTPRLQCVLDALGQCPAIVKTATWDVVAWNRAAAVVLTDYGKLAREQRNILRLMFCNPRARAAQTDWEGVARFVVAAFRADAMRAGSSEKVEALVADLSRQSAEFRTMWAEHEVRAHGEGTKHLRHPVVGLIGMEYSAFGVDGRPDLGMVVYTPSTPEDAALIRALIEADPAR